MVMGMMIIIMMSNLIHSSLLVRIKKRDKARAVID